MVLGLNFQPALERTPHDAGAGAVGIEIGKPFCGKPTCSRQMLCNQLSAERGPCKHIECTESTGLIQRDAMSVTAQRHAADLSVCKAEGPQIISKIPDPRSRLELASERRELLQVVLPLQMKSEKPKQEMRVIVDGCRSV